MLLWSVLVLLLLSVLGRCWRCLLIGLFEEWGRQSAFVWRGPSLLEND